jgi:hypothetical protein
MRASARMRRIHTTPKILWDIESRIPSSPFWNKNYAVSYNTAQYTTYGKWYNIPNGAENREFLALSKAAIPSPARGDQPRE